MQILKQITMLAFFVLALGICASAQVTVSGSTGANGSYTELNLAFTAINGAGTQAGNAIAVDITGNTTETASAILNAGDWTSLTVRPSGGARIIEGSIIGAIIKLNGADNVTIDGRIGGTGTNRDLTVRNNNTAAATAAIWLASVAAGNGASNNVVRNLELACGTDTTSSGNATFGIIMSGTTISTTANGDDNDNNQFVFNRIIKARYGIVTRGTTTNLNIAPIVSDNIIGPAAFGTDQIGKTGILMQADTGATVSRNTVQFVGCLTAQLCAGADRIGIGIGSEAWSATDTTTITSANYTVTKNIIHDIIEEKTFSTVGIKLGTTQSGGATGNLVANNFLYNLRANGTSGDQLVGIGIGGGNGDRVVFNSISLTGDVDPGAAAASTTYGNAIRIPGANGTNNANFVIQNNSIYLDASSSSTTALRFYAITLNSAAYSFGTGSLNYNNYYINPANTQLRTGGLGTGTAAAATTEFATLADWRLALTAPQDANSIQANPNYASPTSDLHIISSSPNVNAGTPVAGVTDDIDSEVRPNGPAPDIGADEFYAAPGVLQFSSVTYSGNEGATATITVTRTAGGSGTVTVAATLSNGTATGGAACGAGVDFVNPGAQTLTFGENVFSQTISVQLCSDAVIDPSETFVVTLSNPTGGATIGANNPATVTIIDIAPPFTGTISVGTGQTYTSLTNTGGLFEALNNSGATGNVTINIASDLTAETGSISLNELAGGFTVTIQPSGGAARVISGSNTTALINLNGADNVTIDGLNTGGNSLLIRNTGTAGAVIRLINDASNNTIRNITVEGATSSNGIFIATGITTGNDNNTITANVIRDRSDAVGIPFNAIVSSGSASAALANSGTIITNNQITNFTQAGIIFLGASANENVTVTGNNISSTADRTTVQIGIYLASNLGTNIVSQNQIHDLRTSFAGGTGISTAGILLLDARDTTVSRNRIYNFAGVAAGTGRIVGIELDGASGTAAAANITNNMISISTSVATAQSVFGLFDFSFGGNTFTADFNSVYIGGTASGAAPSWAIVRGTAAPSTYTARNNIAFNNRTGGTGSHFAAGDQSANTGTFVSNYNFFAGTGATTAANFFDYGTAGAGTPVNFAAWQAGPPTRDANSIAGVASSFNPANFFVNAAGGDLHLISDTTPVSNLGTPIAGLTTDFDGQTRSATTPDIGADEFVVLVPGTIALSSATYTVAENVAGGNATITVNRTGGTDGAVSVTYVLSGGTATGGAVCGGAVDYVNTGGTVSFANGESTKTITVPICDDAVFEGSETFNVTISAPTGGATLGAQSTAVVTITDNEVAQPGTVQFSAATYTVGESGGTATITVNRTGGTDGSVTVDYATAAGGTATGGAACAAGIDYVNASGTLTFGAGVASQTITITICNDAVSESSETVNLALSNVTGGATIGAQSTAVLTITDDDAGPAGNVVVNPGNVSYTTLGEAVTAINAGTHTGAVTVDINASTTETGPVVLNGSGAGAASYTSLVIRPTVDAATIAGPTATGRGLIELNGADNVTIDGDNANTAGTNRNLTITNTAANTVTFTSVIRIAVNATTVTSADNDVIRNLNINGNATGRNISTANLTTASENNTYGIIATASASAPTTAPTAIASLTLAAGTGATATNLTVSNNNIQTAARGVAIQGSATTVFPGLLVQNNTIGNSTAGDANQIYNHGVIVNGTADGVVSGNTIYVEGFVGSSGNSATVGIAAGAISANTTVKIEKNKINRVLNENPATWAVHGINLGGGNNHVVQNNFVSNLRNNQVAGTSAFSTTFGLFGIRVGSGTGHKIYHNSVNLFGVIAGAVNTNLTAAFGIAATGQTGVDVRNNIFVNTLTGGNPTGTRNVAVYLPAAATVAMNLTMNNNDYFVGSDANNRLAQVGATFGTGEYTLADFDPSTTTPATNFRAYTSTLSAAGTNDNASKKVDPLFVSNTDLHLQTLSPMESAGANVGVTDDIDGNTRSTVPDIGADEITVAGPGVLQLSSTSYSGAEGTTATITVVRTGGVDGAVGVTATVTDGTATGGAACGAGVDYINPGPQTLSFANGVASQTFTIQLCTDAVLESGETVIITLSNPTGTTIGANNPATLTIIDVPPPFSGTVNVGAGETFTSLTNPGGVFQAINGAGLSANLTINITSDLTAETGAIALNQFTETGAGGYTLTFKPSGAARTISGTAAALSMIKLNGADRVTFDGSLSGGTDRSLSLLYTNTGGTVVWIAAAGAGNGANNNTFKNCIIAANPGTQSVAGVLGGSGVTLGGAAEAPNNNNTIQNNAIFRVQNSIYNQGAVALDQNWNVTGNTFGSTVAADKNGFRGMLMGNTQNFVINGNTVNGVSIASTTAGNHASGIQLAFALNGGTIVNNKISDIRQTGTQGAYGIQISSTSAAANVTIANNFIWDVAAVGSATVINNGFGININGAGAGGYGIYHNSVNMTGSQASGTTAAMGVQAAATGGLNIRNNIFANTQAAGATRYAFYSAVAATVYSAIDYNDYFAPNVGFLGTPRVTLADWQAATGQDANSKAVDPLFVSATDLHLQAGSPMINMGTTIAAVTTDIDGQPRDATPDIGADEVVAGSQPGTLSLSSATYTVSEGVGVAIITVNRTGGTSGTVSAAFATSNGTAIGGPSCANGPDYMALSGFVNFNDGETTKTFGIPICDDTIVEGNETFNVTLTNPVGGATLGTPSTAVVTITDNDVSQGTFSINDVRVYEGDSGTTTATFTVTLTAPPAFGGSPTASVFYTTANGTATANVDYQPASGTLTFPSGTTTQTITVQVIGDTVKEANETFFVNLSGAQNSTVGDAQGVGIIVDNDRAYTGDFDRDLHTDLTVFRPSTGYWYTLQSTNDIPVANLFGVDGDVPVPGDYDADGITDLAVFRPSNGTWYIQNSSNFAFSFRQFGLATDKPVQGDYDGDTKTDIAVYRDGVWYVLPSSSPDNPVGVAFGSAEDIPVQGDYNGDHRTDLAVFRPSNGTWYVQPSTGGASTAIAFGQSGDKPVVGDFDGDGKSDFTVYRAGIWYIYQTLTQSARAVAFGDVNDIPNAGDYDGDGTTDIAVFRPSTGVWYSLNSSNGGFMSRQWGQAGDVPIPAAYQFRLP